MTEEEFRTGTLANGERLMQPPEIPLLTFTEAQAIGAKLHDRWQTMTCAASSMPRSRGARPIMWSSAAPSRSAT